MKAITFLLIILVFFFTIALSCKKDKLNCKPYNYNTPEDSLCFDFEIPAFGIVTTIDERYIHTSPCMNPNNSNEFIYLLTDQETDERFIMKYNLLTNESIELTQVEDVRQEFTWGKQGWIAYVCLNPPYIHQLWVLREDGSDHHVFSPDNFYNNFPFWDDSGENLYWTKVNNPDPDRHIVTLKKNINTLVIDTVPEGIVFSADMHNNKVLAFRNYQDINHTGFYDFSNGIVLGQDNFTKIIEYSTHSNPIYAKWSKTGDYIFAIVHNEVGHGLYKIDLNGQTTILRKFCTSLDYCCISVSSDNKFMLLNKRNFFPDSDQPHVINITVTLVSINLETGEETQILPN